MAVLTAEQAEAERLPLMAVKAVTNDPAIWLIIALSCVVVLVWLFWSPQALKTPVKLTGRVSYVVDGDSLYIHGHKPQIRLWGVDAPEKSESGFQAATDYLFLIAQGQHITCLIITTDRYGRIVARCFLPDGREINRLMIESGKTREYHRFTKGFYKQSV